MKKTVLIFVCCLQMVSTVLSQSIDPILLQAGFSEVVIARGDFNKDSIPDILVRATSGCLDESELVYYTGTGNYESYESAYTETQRISVNLPYSAFPPLDLDGDADLDIVLHVQLVPNFKMRLLNQTDSFEIQEFESSLDDFQSFAEDINLDSISDYYSFDENTSSAHYHISNQSGGWQKNLLVDFDKEGVFSMSDFNNDGNLDVLFLTDTSIQLLELDSFAVVKETDFRFDFDEIYERSKLRVDLDLNGEQDIFFSRETDNWREDSLFVLLNISGDPFIEFVSVVPTVSSVAGFVSFKKDSNRVALIDVLGNFHIGISSSEDGVFMIDTIRLIGANGFNFHQEDFDFETDIEADYLFASDNIFDFDEFAVKFKKISSSVYLIDVMNFSKMSLDAVNQCRLADIDNNGVDDLIVLENQLLFSLINDGEDLFAKSIEIFEGLGGVRDFDIADMNADGIIDILLEIENQLLCFDGLGNGDFDEPKLIGSNDNYFDFEIVDLNNDGLFDVLKRTSKGFGSRNRLEMLTQDLNGNYDLSFIDLGDYISILDISCSESSSCTIAATDETGSIFEIYEDGGSWAYLEYAGQNEWGRLDEEMYLTSSSKRSFVQVKKDTPTEGSHSLFVLEYDWTSNSLISVFPPVEFELDFGFSFHFANPIDLENDGDIDLVVGTDDQNMTFENIDNESLVTLGNFYQVFDIDEFPSIFKYGSNGALYNTDDSLRVSHLFIDCSQLYIINGFGNVLITDADDTATLFKQTVFPNPSTGLFQVALSYDAEYLSIFNAAGQVLQQIQVTGKNASFDISGKPYGIYQVVTYNSNGEMLGVVKLVKTD